MLTRATIASGAKVRGDQDLIEVGCVSILTRQVRIVRINERSFLEPVCSYDADHLNEFAVAVGLLEICVASEVIAKNDVAARIGSRKDENGDVTLCGVGAYGLQHLKAVLFRHI